MPVVSFGAPTGKDLIIQKTLTTAEFVEFELDSKYSSYEFMVVALGATAITLSTDGGSTWLTSGDYETHISDLRASSASYLAVASTSYNGMSVGLASTGVETTSHGFLSDFEKSGIQTKCFGQSVSAFSTIKEFYNFFAVRSATTIENRARIGKTHAIALDSGSRVSVWGIK